MNEIAAAVTQRFPNAGVISEEYRDNSRLMIPAESVYVILEYLKTQHQFDMLCDIAGIDYLGYPDASDRYGIVYSLTNIESGLRLFVKTFVNDPEPELASVTPLWDGANWMEREVFDMFGVKFVNHPDHRRILLPEEFTSYPLRKDYPLRGYGERHNMEVITRSEG